MLNHLRCARWLLAGVLVVVAACGGGGGGDGSGGGNSGSGGGGGSGGSTTAPPPSTPALPKTLALSVPTIALALAGRPRVVTVTNNGSTDAFSLQYTVTPALPAGTVLNFGCPATLAPGASCSITLTPGGTPTAAAGVTPAASVLSVAGSNTSAVTTDVLVVTHGSVYQSGYVFSLNDSTPNTGSVGGKVVALSDASASVPWSTPGDGPDGLPLDPQVATVHLVPGIDEQSVAGPGTCNGRSDGPCNSRVITDFYPLVDKSLYAAGNCKLPKDERSDWYLPAICELDSCGAGDNVLSRLINNGVLTAAQLPRPGYWSSTSSYANPDGLAWVFSTVTNSGVELGKDYSLGVRCVRALTP